jgi:hypothetical protein
MHREQKAKIRIVWSKGVVGASQVVVVESTWWNGKKGIRTSAQLWHSYDIPKLLYIFHPCQTGRASAAASSL